MVARREMLLNCENLDTHKHLKAKEWLAAFPRFCFHFTLTSPSWLNLGEWWLSAITSQAIRRGRFAGVHRLELQIARFIAEWNENARPCVWTKPPRGGRLKILRVLETSEILHSEVDPIPWTITGRR